MGSRPQDASSGTSIVGLVVSDITNPVFFDVIRGAEAAATSAGYTLVLTESEESDDRGVEGELGQDPSDDQVHIADPRVDAVLDSLAGLDERPVTEHAAVFERAHEELRAALEPDRESA